MNDVVGSEYGVLNVSREGVDFIDRTLRKRVEDRHSSYTTRPLQYYLIQLLLAINIILEE